MEIGCYPLCPGDFLAVLEQLICSGSMLLDYSIVLCGQKFLAWVDELVLHRTQSLIRPENLLITGCENSGHIKGHLLPLVQLDINCVMMCRYMCT